MENFDRKVWDIFVKYEDVVSDEDDYNAMANAVRDSLYRDDLIGNYSMDVDGNISMDSDVEILSQDADSLGLSDYHDLEKYLENDFFLKYEEELEKYYDSKTNKNFGGFSGKIRRRAYDQTLGDKGFYYFDDSDLVFETQYLINHLDEVFKALDTDVTYQEWKTVGPDQEIRNFMSQVESLEISFNKMITMFKSKLNELRDIR